MKKISNPEIINVIRSTRSVQIEWRDRNADIEAVSCLYLHSDGTWAVDPWTRSLGTTFGEKLLGSLVKEFVMNAFIYDDSSSFAGSDVARVEGIIKADELYRQSFNKKPTKPAKPKKQPVRVWFAD